MDDLKQQLEALLQELGESAAFVTHGTLPPVLPGLEVEGAGSIGLPVSAEDARRLIMAADQAPYGRGTETIVDTDVRRVWQLEPSGFSLRNPGWQTHVDEIVQAVAQRFAITGDVRSELYKLLVYEAGSFFAPHRDTEKTPGMFATLVISLPSRHEGGVLVVAHEDRTERIDFGGPESEFRTGYAAFYTDCRHEITPLVSGYRVCLIYNLALDHTAAQPSAPESSPAIAEAAALLRELFADESLSLNKLVIPFEHQYTEAGLAPTALKGADRARADVLAHAAASLDYDCSLALVTHYQTGSVSPDSWISPYYRSRSSYRRSYYEEAAPEDDGESAEMEEVIEEYITLNHWLDMDGRERPFGELEVDDDELLYGEEREGWSVRQSISEATGNAGASLERWYHGGALVIWPRDRFFDILASEGQVVALPELERMAAGAQDEEAVAACRDFAGAILGYWSPNPVPGGTASVCGRMLTVLAQIGTVELAQQFVRDVLPLDFSGDEGSALCRLCGRFGWEALRPALSELLERQQPAPYEVAPTRLLPLLDPLYGEPATWTEERQAVCASLARELARVLARWVPQARLGYLLPSAASTGLVARAVRIFTAGQAPEARDYFLDRALRGELGCGLHDVLLPDLKTLAGWLPELPAAWPAYSRLREHCVAQLRAATAEPVLPPTDWRREAELSCKCPDCEALASFLTDPRAPLARFPLAERRRQHLHHQIDAHHCDCTHVTERKGRPYTLVCQKTRASYERRERQYQQDRMLLEEINRLPAHHRETA